MKKDKYTLAREGKTIWDELDGRIGADRYLVMPHLNHEYNTLAVKYLKEFINKYSIRRLAFIHLPQETLSMTESQAFGTDIEYVSMSEDDMNRIVLLYGLYKFSDKVTILSLTKPYDTGGERLLGIKGTTREDLFCFDVFKIDRVLKGE